MNTLVKKNNLFPSTSFFDDFFTKDLLDWPGSFTDGGTLPKVNIMESADNFEVEMAAPGMKKDDFNIELDNDNLIIEAEIKKEDEQHSENGRYNRKEFSYTSFKRSFYLPNTIEIDKIKAKYHDGILSLVIPKKEEAKRKPVKTIAIS
ncbi:MAG: Hsp20/alpha crystallin family protein [Bacteroidota bacterium]